MHITDLLCPEGILLGAAVPDKAAAIHAMAGLMAACGNLSDPEAYEQSVFAREAQGTTGVGGGIAIPHGKCAAVQAAGLVAMTLREDLDYQALDGKPVRLLFLIAAPENASDLHVQVLAQLAKLLMDHDFCGQLLSAATPQEFLGLIAAREGANAKKPPEAPAPAPYRLLAVTGCPTGIAHTYMAAEALQSAAKEMGLSLKVETDGAAGAQNKLTAQEIAEAECILIAADRAVETARFAGKPVLRVPVSEALRRPEALLRRALDGTAPVQPAARVAQPLSVPPPTPAGTAAAQRGKWAREFIHRMYTDLMNGVAHMIPFVVGGGILIALAYLFDGTNVGSIDFGTGTDISWALRTVGQAAFDLMYPILAAYIAISIADTPALLPGFIGGYLARSGMSSLPETSWVSSGFWGALIAGFAAGLLMRGVKRLLSKLPTALEQIKTTVLYPVLGMLLMAGLMTLVVNPPMGHFNAWLYNLLGTLRGGSRIVLGAVLGGMMAVDFGGPLNKAAYLFGTVALTGDQYDIMASVMLGGMVPPMAVALACGLFRNRFTPKERQTALTNYLLGASFVTEGALPFALRDPLRVIPACVVGSTMAGALSMAFGCGIPAPHGGLYLLPLASNPVGLLVALAAGSLAAALLLGRLKKPLEQE